MLELQPKPQFSVVIPPKLLQEGYLVTFTQAWPATYSAYSGKTFRVDVAVQIPYDLSYNIAAGDYVDVDFSNNHTLSENVYPEQDVSLFETAIGFKPGSFITEWFIPAGKSLDRLEYAQMEPDVTDPKRLFLGAFKATDSPYEDPRIKAYFVHNFTPLIMRIYVLADVDYEKVVAGLTINRLKLTQIVSPTPDQLAKSKVIRYYDEMRW